MIIYLMIILLSFLTCFVCGANTAFFTISVFFIGQILLLGRSENRCEKRMVNGVLFCAGWGYMLACYAYMKVHDFQWLLAYDTFNYFLPKTELYLQLSNGDFFNCIKTIFEDFNFFDRNQYAYWVYNCLWGIIGSYLNVDLYYTLQLSTLFLYGFSGVIICNIFKKIGISVNIKRNTVIICLCSVLFFYSSQILRDTHILICYLLAIDISLRRDHMFMNLLGLIIVIFITCLIRIESGIFLSLCMPVFLIAYSKAGKSNFIIPIVVFLFVLISLSYVLVTQQKSIIGVYEDNQSNFFSTDIGNGVIGRLEKIPVLGKIFAIFYNAVQPVPMWGRMFVLHKASYGGEAYNVMNFVRGISSYFHVLVITTLFIIGNNLKRWKPIIKEMPLAFKLQMILGFVYLYIQARVMSQRRLMGYYCVFFIFFFVIFELMKPGEKKKFINSSLVVFIILQFIGMLLNNPV